MHEEMHEGYDGDEELLDLSVAYHVPGRRPHTHVTRQHDLQKEPVSVHHVAQYGLGGRDDQSDCSERSAQLFITIIPFINMIWSSPM